LGHDGKIDEREIQEKGFLMIINSVISIRYNAVVLFALAILAVSSSFAIPINQLGAEADKKVVAQGVNVTSEGLRLSAPLQKLEAYIAPQGAIIRSISESEGKGDFSIDPVAMGRGSRMVNVSAKGTVSSQDGHSVLLDREIVVERFSASSDGIRQDFVIEKKPRGQGVMTLMLTIRGATATMGSSGIAVTIPAGRKFVYGNLQTMDAKGKTLVAKMEAMNGSELKIMVEDAGAAYPVTIDPTITDADWVSMGGFAGAYGNVRALLLKSGRLYIAGFFTMVGATYAGNIAQWDGSKWSALGAGTGIHSWISTLAMDKKGILYAGGSFDSAGGVPAARIAQWDGSKWSALGKGIAGSQYKQGIINYLACDDSGNLFADGSFDTAGGIFVNDIAKWDGNKWDSTASAYWGFGPFAKDTSGKLCAIGYNDSNVSYLVKFSGNHVNTFPFKMHGTEYAFTYDNKGALYLGGTFDSVGGVPCKYIAKWDGATWRALGPGMNKRVVSLACDSNGNVYAGGEFDSIGNVRVNHIAKWDGSQWQKLGRGTNAGLFSSLAVDGNGDLFASGFDTADGIAVGGIAKWNGSDWSTIGPTTSDKILAIAKDGAGGIYVGGYFAFIGGFLANHIAQWDGSKWKALGKGLNNTAYTLSLDSNKNLYAGGMFDSAGGSPAREIAKWDGKAWSPLGTGMNNSVAVIVNDKNGNLYAGGNFDSVGGINTGCIAKWDGAAWSPLGKGISLDTSSRVSISYYMGINSLAFDNNGMLYAGGYFTYIGGVAARGIARWNGSAWSALDTGFNETVISIAFSPNGDLYAGGINGGISKWDGTSWNLLASGKLSSLRNPYLYPEKNIFALLFDKNGNLFVGGCFDTIARRYPAHNIAVWNGKKWFALGSGLETRTGNLLSSVNAMVLFDSLLYVGGNFNFAGGQVSNYIARVNIHTIANPVIDGVKSMQTTTIRYRLVKSTLVISGVTRQDRLSVYTVSGRCVRQAQGASAMKLTGLAPQPLLIRVIRAGKIVSTGMVVVQ